MINSMKPVAHNCFRKLLHFLDKCWRISNWILRNDFSENWIYITISCQENSFKVDHYKKVKVYGFSSKFGKIKKMGVWFHSRKAGGVNPA